MTTIKILKTISFINFTITKKDNLITHFSNQQQRPTRTRPCKEAPQKTIYFYFKACSATIKINASAFEQDKTTIIETDL
ncbi:hypothetical protein ACU9D5_004111 [Cronobacter dublinensis]